MKEKLTNALSTLNNSDIQRDANALLEIINLLPKNPINSANELNAEHWAKFKQLSDDSRQLKTRYGNQLPTDVHEFIDHYHDRYNQFMRQQSSAVLPTSKSLRFTIKHWDKSRLDTLTLGDNVDCCLVTTGSQFATMIQRRIDDAMFFHVVLSSDEQPIALNWLYFAKDKMTQTVYVIANFFEIAGKYGHDANIREAIIARLLEFTNQYAQAIGAKGFLLNHLRYSLIPDFKYSYTFTKQTITPEKIGGFLCMDGKKLLCYLNSLDSRNFYICTTDELSDLALTTIESNPAASISSASTLMNSGVFAKTIPEKLELLLDLVFPKNESQFVVS